MTEAALFLHIDDLHHDNSDQESGEHEEYSELIQVRHCSIEEAYGKARDPGDDDVRDKYMPWLRNIVWMLQGVPEWISR